MENCIKYYAIVNTSYIASKELNSLDKLLLIHITGLCNKEGYCFATNKYFANIYGHDRKTISRSINKLVSLNILKSKLEYNNTNLSKRYLSIHPSVSTNRKTGLGPEYKASINENVHHKYKYEKIKEKENNIPIWMKHPEMCTSTPCTDEELKEMEELLSQFKEESHNE